MIQTTLIGFLGKDPEEKVTQNGRKGYFFSIAVDLFASGEKKTTWFNISVWEESLFGMVKCLSKGSLAVITGTPSEPYIYQSKDGENKISQSMKATSISFVPSKKEKEEDNEEKKEFTPGYF